MHITTLRLFWNSLFRKFNTPQQNPAAQVNPATPASTAGIYSACVLPHDCMSRH